MIKRIDKPSLHCTHLGVNCLHYCEIGFRIQPLRLSRPLLCAHVSTPGIVGSKVKVKVKDIRSKFKLGHMMCACLPGAYTGRQAQILVCTPAESGTTSQEPGRDQVN